MLLGSDQVSLHPYFDCIADKLFYYQMCVLFSFVHFSSLICFSVFFFWPSTSLICCLLL